MRLLAATTQLAVAVFGTVLGPPLAIASDGDGVDILLTGRKGLGAFAARDIEAGAYLGRYTGALLTAEEALSRWQNGETSGDYFATMRGITRPMVIDAEDYETSGWPRFINHSKRRANCANVELRQPLTPGSRGPRLPLGLYVQAVRDIKRGEELLVDYGDAYWTNRGFAPNSPRRWRIDNL